MDGDEVPVVVSSWNIRRGQDNRHRDRGIEELYHSAVRLLAGSVEGPLPERWVLALVEHHVPPEGGSIAAHLALRLGASYEVLTLGPRVASGPAPAHDLTAPGDGIALLTNLKHSREPLPASLGHVPGESHRQGLQVRIRPEPGIELNVVVAHLTCDFRQSPAQVRQLIAHSAAQDLPTVSMGDLNCWRRVVRRTAVEYRHRVVPGSGATWPVGKLFVPSISVLDRPVRAFRRLRGHSPSLPAAPFAGLDSIVVSPGLTVAEAQVVRGLGSDHHGVRAVLHLG